MIRDFNVNLGQGLLGSVVALAWVCTLCSAAFPIAIGKGRIVGEPQPLFRNGERMLSRQGEGKPRKKKVRRA